MRRKRRRELVRRTTGGEAVERRSHLGVAELVERSGELDGPTEAEFGVELDLEMRRRGATERSFETIVASGPNAASPAICTR